MSAFKAKSGNSSQESSRKMIVGGAQRIESPDGYVFPLSIESGLVYIHSIWVPTDDDLQQSPMYFSHHLTFRMHMFLTMALHLLFLRRSNKKLMKIPFLMNFEIFATKWYSTSMFSGIQVLQRMGSIPFMLIFTRAFLLRKIRSPPGFILDGNLNKTIQDTRLLPGLEVLSLNLIT